jgi:hypothetical protein
MTAGMLGRPESLAGIPVSETSGLAGSMVPVPFAVRNERGTRCPQVLTDSGPPQYYKGNYRYGSRGESPVHTAIPTLGRVTTDLSSGDPDPHVPPGWWKSDPDVERQVQGLPRSAWSSPPPASDGGDLDRLNADSCSAGGPLFRSFPESFPHRAVLIHAP